MALYEGWTPCSPDWFGVLHTFDLGVERAFWRGHRLGRFFPADGRVLGSFTKREWCNMFDSQLREVWEVLEMARGKGTGKGASPAFKPTTWVNVTLTAEQRDAIRKWDVETDEIEQSVMQLLAEGYKLSVSWDTDAAAVSVILFDRRPDEPTDGWGLSSRAPTVFDALRVTLFKHLVVLNRDWRAYKADRPDEDFA